MTDVPAVYQAIANVTDALCKTGVAKARKNQMQGYNFRGIDDIYNALAPELAKNKLCILPTVLERSCEERQTAKGSALFYVNVRVRFDFVSAEDGSRHEVTTLGEAMDSADKATNKAMSAAYKYATMMAFCIPTVGEDSESETHEVRPAPQKVVPLRQPASPPHDTETGEILAPHAILVPDRQDKWLVVGRQFIAAIRTAQTPAELDAWQRDNASTLASISMHESKAFGFIKGALAKEAARLGPADDLVTEEDASSVLDRTRMGEP